MQSPGVVPRLRVQYSSVLDVPSQQRMASSFGVVSLQDYICARMLGEPRVDPGSHYSAAESILDNESLGWEPNDWRARGVGVGVTDWLELDAGRPTNIRGVVIKSDVRFLPNKFGHANLQFRATASVDREEWHCIGDFCSALRDPYLGSRPCQIIARGCALVESVPSCVRFAGAVQARYLRITPLSWESGRFPSLKAALHVNIDNIWLAIWALSRGYASRSLSPDLRATIVSWLDGSLPVVS
jgi:hypothetical protein